MSNTTLVNADDCILVAIDIQDAFLEKLPESKATQVIRRACWLINVAKWLNIPIVVTAEDMADLGTVHSSIQDCLRNESIYDKMIFGLAEQVDIMSAIQETKRKTCILIGLETDVCVAQSALGLMQKGYQVIVVADATGSPKKAHKAGLKRIQKAGALIIQTKALYYEWIRTVEKAKAFKLAFPQLASADSF